ncbi:TPA: hypothetical protein ACH3X1_000762 [Trebouxia sp. C0004]
MGNDKHKKSHKRKRSDESEVEASDSSDASQQHKKSKKHKKDKVKKDKHKKSKKDDKRIKEAKKFLRQTLKDKAGGTEDAKPLDSNTQIENIDKDDYFAKNAEFTAWLREQRSKYFNEMDSDETRALFDEFVEEWNGRRLFAKYYAGMTTGAGVRRTKHQWGIRQGGDADLASGAVGMAAAMEEEREAEQAARQGQQVERRKWRADQKDWLEEQLPKATGRCVH